EITAIMPRVSGYVTELLVSDNEAVTKGDPLVRIDDREIRSQLETVEVELLRLEAETESVLSRKALQQFIIEQASAELSVAEAEGARAASELSRIERLARTGNTSDQALEDAIASHATAQGEVVRAQSNLAATEAEIGILEAEEKILEAQIKKTEAELEIQRIRLEDTVVRTPISGVVGNRSVRRGELVTPGRFLMAVVPLDRVWIVGNVKEPQLTRFAEGQSVQIKVDTFPSEKINGTVASLSPASGAEFSILPPQNATGNFTKITQRIPVKISIDPGHPVEGRLQPGMSCTVSVDTRGPGTAEAGQD
ncbi:MAG: HlyD family secretion protein, partial [Pseudomonadota bacterium]